MLQKLILFKYTGKLKLMNLIRVVKSSCFERTCQIKLGKACMHVGLDDFLNVVHAYLSCRAMLFAIRLRPRRAGITTPNQGARFVCWYRIQQKDNPLSAPGVFRIAVSRFSMVCENAAQQLASLQCLYVW